MHGKGFATASLVLGIVGFVFWGYILGPLAVVFAIVAKKKGFMGGSATAGLVLGIIVTVISLLWLFVLAPLFVALFYEIFAELFPEMYMWL